MRRGLSLGLIVSLMLIICVFAVLFMYISSRGLNTRGESVTWAAPFQEAGNSSSLFTGGIPKYVFQEETEELNLPCHVGEFNLEKLASGDEALDYAKRMHGDDAPLENVLIPYYRGKDEQVTVWIFETSSSVAAKKHLIKIKDRITEHHSEDEFSSFFLQNVLVYHLKSCNMYNYFYRKNEIIYWISLATSDPLPLFLRFYEHF